MLRFAYNLGYKNSLVVMKLTAGPQIHMKVFTAAKKYLYPRLEALALTEFRCQGLAEIESNFTKNISGQKKGAAEMIEVLEFLLTYRDQYSTLSGMLNDLVRKHLPNLFVIPEFRALLEAKENKDILDLTAKAVELAHAVERAPKRTMKECYKCDLVWLDTTEGRCPRCKWEDRGTHTSSKWRQI